MTRNLTIAVIVIILLVAGFIFIRSSNQNALTPTPSPVAQMSPEVTPSETASPSATASSSAQVAQQITVTGTEFAFTPSTINVKMGQPVTITFKNAGKFSHNLTIAGLNVATKTIPAGQSDSVTFTPAKAGSFSFVCTVDSHADKGMKGTIVVK